MDKQEMYLISIDHTLKLILKELQKDEQKETPKKKRPVTKEEMLQRSIKGTPLIVSTGLINNRG